MKVAIYARYSSDNQRDASIADQIRLCRGFAERQGWSIAQEFADHAASGATLLRPGFQRLMRDALEGRFDAVMAESLDRFSRDQEDTAGFFKRLTFVEGSKTGYCRQVTREIEPVEACVVQRIFRNFCAGISPKEIARCLNREGRPGPAGTSWNPSTIHGNVVRGTGILNSELYVGRLVWNRQRYIKDPDTGKQQARLNPSSEWITAAVPSLRIIDDELWNQAKARQAVTRRAIALDEGQQFNRFRRPKYLFSGLTKCGQCGGGYIMHWHEKLACLQRSLARHVHQSVEHRPAGS